MPVAESIAPARWLLIGLALWAGSAPAAGRGVHEWLAAMSEAVQNLNYKGIFVYAHGDQLEAMRIYHANDGDGEHERLVSLNGAPREVLRDHEHLTCILPDKEAVMVEKSRPRKYLPEALLGDLGALEPHYRFELGGTDRMAGRPARVVMVSPRDAYRYGYRLWLDQEHAMILKSDLVDHRGRAIEQVMFVDLQVVPKLDPRKLAPAISGEGYRWFRSEIGDGEAAPGQGPGEERAEERGAAGTGHHSQWVVTRAPPGFVLRMSTHHPLPIGPAPVEHLVLSDGLASVSVFIERAMDEADALTGVSSMGAVNAYGRRLAGYQVTVVGEVPQATVVMIGKSIVYRGGGRGETP